jgi:hypothetical protein
MVEDIFQQAAGTLLRRECHYEVLDGVIETIANGIRGHDEGPAA